MDKNFILTIPYEKMQAMNGELLIETLAFQNVIVEMLLIGDSVKDEQSVNRRLDFHRARIWDKMYAEYGMTPGIFDDFDEQPK